MDMDNEMVFWDALLYVMEGESPSKAIENQEARGQREVVRNLRLPNKSNDRSIPDAYKQYELMGIKVVGEYDDLFYSVELPEGWEIKATDHSMWNDVYDNKGRKRMNYFYKAAFYDRDAFVNFNTRYSISVVPFDEYKTDATYKERSTNPWYGVAYDSGNEIFRTVGEVSPDGTVPSWEIQEHEKLIVLKYINEHFPQWQDTNAYWDK